MADKLAAIADIAGLITDEQNAQNTAGDVREAIGVALDYTDDVAEAKATKEYVDGRFADLTTITDAQAEAIQENSAKVGITSAQAQNIIVNSAKVGITAEQAQAIADHAVRDGITPEQALAITANSAKIGITAQQAQAIIDNTAKVGLTTAQQNAINANTAKVGITQSQALAIIANSGKVGITPNQANAIILNSQKLGITASQANAIIANSQKAGITQEQANAIIASTQTDIQQDIDIDALQGNSRTEGAVRALAEAQITTELEAGGKISDAITQAGGGGGTEGALVLEDLALVNSCQVQGVDATPSNSGTDFTLSLTCIGNAPSEGTGLLDGIITLQSDTNLIWDGMGITGGNPTPLVATRMPNDGAANNPTQKWIVKGQVFDFTRQGIIIIDSVSGETNLTGSFEGNVFFAGRGVDSVEAIVAETVNPSLVSKDIAEHPDVFLPSLTSDFSGVVGTPTHYSQSITITDPEANPFETAAITFIHTMRAIGAVGSRQPIMTFQITQRGAVLFNGRFSNPSDQIMVAFNGYLNEAWEIHEQILWGTDDPSDHFRGELKQIQSARKGALYDVIQLAIQNATQSQFNLLTADVAKISALVSGFGDTLQGLAEGEARNSEILNRDAMAILARAVVDDTNKTTDDPTEANLDLGTDNSKGEAQVFLRRYNAADGYQAGTRKFAGIITNENPEFTYAGERLVWAENGRLKTKFRHNAVLEVRRDLTHYPTDAAGDDAVADIVRSLSTSGAVQLTQNLPPVNTPITIYAVVESVNGDRYQVITLTGNWLAGFTTTADIPEPSTGSVSLTARNNNGALALEYAVSGHNPAINASSLRMRALWVEPNGQIITEAADAYFEDRDIGAFNGQAIFGVDLDLANGGNFTNVGIVASNFTLDTNWFPNAIESSPEIGIDARGSLLTDNAGMTLFRSRAVDAYTGETFATIQGYGDAGELDMGMFSLTEHHLRKIISSAQLEVPDDTGGFHNVGNALRDAGAPVSGVIVGRSVNGAGVQFTTLQWRLTGAGINAGVLTGFPADQVFHGVGFVVIADVDKDITFRQFGDFSNPAFLDKTFTSAELVRGFQRVFNSISHKDVEDDSPILRISSTATAGDILLEATFSKMVAPNLPTE